MEPQTCGRPTARRKGKKHAELPALRSDQTAADGVRRKRAFRSVLSVVACFRRPAVAAACLTQTEVVGSARQNAPAFRRTFAHFAQKPDGVYE